MSKPDPAGGSLEAILASIRKSLAEQSGEAPAEASREPDAKATRRHGLTERLAGTAPAAAEAPQPSDDLSDLLESPGDPTPSAPAAAPQSQSTSPATEDPLWFLTRREEPQPPARQSLLGLDRDPGATPAPATPATEPSLTRPEVLRASMPPFFGSSSEGATVTPPVETPASAQHEQPASAEPAVAPASTAQQNPAMAREVSLVAAAVETAAGRPVPPGASGLNGASGGNSGLPDPSAAPADAANNRALEAVVLDLLKPMLRQWLDENMPRLVAQALGEEAGRARTPDGGKKL